MSEDRKSGGSESGASPGAPKVDIERLADRVYRLMQAELQLELARSGGQRTIPRGQT